MTGAIAEDEKAIAKALRLRAPAPVVTQLSRKVLIGLGAVLIGGLAAALAWGLSARSGRPAGPEVYATGGQPPERLSALPKDYAGPSRDLPLLGPPLPGDLGRPIVSAQRAGVEVTPTAMAPVPVDRAARDPGVQARDAARASGLFLASATRPIAAASRGSETVAPQASAVQRTGDPRLVSAERLQAPASPYLLQAGAMIPAVMVTGIRSDLPGMVIAQVTETVRDSVTGQHVLIPQGSRLIGDYVSDIAYGQSRVALVWTRLTLPDGRAIVLDELPASDAEGYSGLQDRVDRHWRTTFGAAVLSTILAIGAETGADDGDSDLARALRRSGAQSVSQVGQQAVGQGLSLAPTLSIRPGAPVRVMVTRDLVLDPVMERR
jgi:type IV secretory pathway VirB10-like protein